MSRLVAVVVLILASCGSAAQAPGQAPVTTVPPLDRGQLVILVGTERIHSACDGEGHRVYESHLGDSRSLAVIADPKCGPQ